MRHARPASSTRPRILSGVPSGAEEGVNLPIRQAVAHTAQVLANRDEPIDPSEHELYEWECSIASIGRLVAIPVREWCGREEVTNVPPTAGVVVAALQAAVELALSSRSSMRRLRLVLCSTRSAPAPRLATIRKRSRRSTTSSTSGSS